MLQVNASTSLLQHIRAPGGDNKIHATKSVEQIRKDVIKVKLETTWKGSNKPTSPDILVNFQGRSQEVRVFGFQLAFGLVDGTGAF